MIGLGLALFYIRATMTNLMFYVFGGAFALLLVAASLLFIAGIDWMCAAGLGRRQIDRLRGSLSLSTVTAAGSLFLIFYPGTTYRMLCDVLAVYALCLTVGKFGLARSWQGSTQEKTTMYLLAGIGLAFTVLLFATGGEDDRQSLAVIAGYALFIGLQMLLSMYFLQRQAANGIQPVASIKHAPLGTLR